MFVSMWMTADPICVGPETSLVEAAKIFSLRSIRRVLVTDPESGKLLGILNKSDLARGDVSAANAYSRAAAPGDWREIHQSPGILGLKPPEPGPLGPNTSLIELEGVVASAMTATPLTIGNHQSVAEAARLMRDRKIGALPVLRKGSVVGIITESDVLDAFVSMLACDKPAVTLTLDLAQASEDWLTSIVAIAKRSHCQVLSVAYLKHEGKPIGVVRLGGNKTEDFVNRLWKAQLSVLSILRENGE